MKQLRQCQLKKGDTYMTAWIDARGAKIDAVVEVKGEGDWTVVAVYGPPMNEADLKEHQQLNRNSLPSVEGMSR